MLASLLAQRRMRAKYDSDGKAKDDRQAGELQLGGLARLIYVFYTADSSKWKWFRPPKGAFFF